MKVIILGGGQVGEYIANLLLNNNYSVKVIDSRENVVAKLLKRFPEGNIIFGNETDPNILEAAGIASADAVVAVCRDDEVNLVASTIAKFEFDVPRVIARVNNPKNAWLFNSDMGVDVGLNQADLMAHLIIEEMDLKNMFTLMKLPLGSYSIVQIKVDDKSDGDGKAVKDLHIPEHAWLIMISRDKDAIIPRGDTIIHGGDIVMALANQETEITLNKLLGAQM